VTGRVPRLLAAALAAAGRGWPVFPVVPYGKRPAITGWPQRATRDPDQLAAWWQRAPYNIGLACGRAGLLVVDLDQAHAGQAPARSAAGDLRDGRAVLAALAREAGHPDPSDTYIVATPHGEHRYFTVPTADLPAARSTTGALGWLVDTRAAGGYVLAAGSVRHVGGQRRYYHRTSPAGVEPAPAPQWLLQALAPPAGPAASRAEPPRHPDAYIRAVLQAKTEQVRGAAVGTRNTTVFHAARRLGQLAAAGLLDHQQITAALRAAAVHHVGIDGFTDAEAARAISNGLHYGLRPPVRRVRSRTRRQGRRDRPCHRRPR
jgi:hypothetical protein